MPIPRNEHLMTLDEAISHVPGRQPTKLTIWRWCKRGCRGVFLEHTHVGAFVMTSAEALLRFIAACDEADQNRLEMRRRCIEEHRRDCACQKSRKSQQRHADKSAEAILESAGI